MATNGNANAVPFIRNSNLFRKRIMDALVCWYDIGKQQCTNESMADNPVLADLSGNGHDATCYNFAWSGMSGVGGYGSDFSIPFKSAGTGEITQTNNKIEIHNWTSESAKLLAFQGNSWKISPGTKIRIHGLSNKYRLTLIALIDGTWNNLIYSTKSESPYVTEDGEYTTLEEIDTSIVNTTQLKIYIIDDNVNTFKNIVIEQLPLYPNALVSDGVDDYAQVTGLPILTGYHLLSKEEVSYEIDSETLTLFKKVNNTEYSSVPLYSLLLFNRTLTQDEIEWVKTNLIEK